MTKTREEMLNEMANNLNGMQLMQEVATPGVVQNISVSEDDSISVSEKADK